MYDLNDSKSKYNNIFNRMKKKFSANEAVYIMKKQYFTNNAVFYILCVFSRFIYLISMSGDYLLIFFKNNSSGSILNYIKKLTCFSLIKHINVIYGSINNEF